MRPKREKFAQEYIINGGNASEAYRTAYGQGRMSNKVLWTRACEMLKKGDVEVRINELKLQLAKKYEIKREAMTENLLLIIEESKERVGKKKRIYNADMLRKATMDAAKLHGLIVDKSEATGLVVTVQSSLVELNGMKQEFDVGEKV